jgi:uncharacterized protein (DUF2062 family)
MTEAVNPEISSEAPACPAGWRGRLVRLAAASGSPKRTALAFAFGVFLSFSPFLGLQVVVGLGAAMVLRFSKAAVFAGLCANMPWVMIPWYTLTTAAGASLLRVPISADLKDQVSRLFDLPVYQSAFWTQAAELAGPFLWCFLIGSTAGALLAGAAAYLAVFRLLSAAGTDRLRTRAGLP